jgi:hypothetical protein
MRSGQVRSGCRTSILHTLIHSLSQSLDAPGRDAALQTSGDKTVTSVNVKAKNHSGTYWT